MVFVVGIGGTDEWSHVVQIQNASQKGDNVDVVNCKMSLVSVTVRDKLNSSIQIYKQEIQICSASVFFGVKDQIRGSLAF